MRRRDLITLIGGAAALPLAARAQRPKKFHLIGVLVSASPPHPFADAFWRGLHALGYSDGENIKVEFRYTDGRSDRAEEYAEELVRFSPDVIVAHYALAVSAAVAATRNDPDCHGSAVRPYSWALSIACLGLVEMSQVYQGWMRRSEASACSSSANSFRTFAASQLSPRPRPQPRIADPS